MPLPLIIGSLLRWMLSISGGALGLQGYIGENDIITASGAIAGLASLAWSIYQKKQVMK